MSTFVRSLLTSLFVVGLAGLAPLPAAGQSTHGAISTVSGNTLYVQLDDSVSAAPGTEGRVVEQRTVGNRTVQVSYAAVTVQRIERSQTGTWTALCRIDRRSEELTVGDRVRLDSTFARPRLTIRTVPPNSIATLDSVTLGTTPMAGPVGVGRHSLTLSQSGYHTSTRTFTIEPGAQRVLVDTLQAARGQLVVNTLPDSATVRVDGDSLGRTPFSTLLQAGTHVVQLTREGYLPARRTVRVPTGEAAKLDVPLRRPLRVSVASSQPDVVLDPQLTRDGDRLILTYDLVGEAEAYAVELQLSTNGGKTFSALPEAVAGAVGDEVSPGSKKQLVWSALEDFPRGFPNANNQVRLVVEEAGGNRLYWVVGSALAAGAGGAVATVLGVFGGGGGGGSDLPSTPPSPPQ
jgi:hypothetical protein